MMIKKIIILLLLFNYSLSFSQKKNNSIGYFDSDNIQDTIFHKFVNDSIKGPIYKCTMLRGNGKKFNFEIGVAFESMRISECKKGCIETYQWKSGMEGFEEYTTYIYNEKYDNWIIERKETISMDGKKEIYKPKGFPKGIDGVEYKIKKQKK